MNSVILDGLVKWGHSKDTDKLEFIEVTRDRVMIFVLEDGSNETCESEMLRLSKEMEMDHRRGYSFIRKIWVMSDIEFEVRKALSDEKIDIRSIKWNFGELYIKAVQHCYSFDHVFDTDCRSSKVEEMKAILHKRKMFREWEITIDLELRW
jgi:hypothetical protein